MSSLEEIYSVPSGSFVEVKLVKNHQILQGNLTIIMNGVCRNPNMDKVRLSKTNDRNKIETVVIPVKDILSVKIVELTQAFRWKRGGDVKAHPPTPPISKPIRAESKKSPTEHTNPRRRGPRGPEETTSVELLLRTVVIRQLPEFKLFLDNVKEAKICGLSFEGQNIGRDGIVSWIIVAAKNTLFPLDIISLTEKDTNTWKLLEKNLFRNRTLRKIIHDGRPAADYLHHVHQIVMKNVVDTQAVDAVMPHQHLARGKGINSASAPPRLLSLSEILQKYEVRNGRIPQEEINFLKKYELEQEFLSDSPIMLRRPLPPPEWMKYCALKVKHLVALWRKMEMEWMTAPQKLMEIHMDSHRRKKDEEYAKLPKETTIISKELVFAIEKQVGQLPIGNSVKSEDENI